MTQPSFGQFWPVYWLDCSGMGIWTHILVDKIFPFLEVQVYLHIRGRKRQKQRRWHKRQLFHNKGKKHQTTSCLYILTLPIREIQDICFFFSPSEYNFVPQSRDPPVCWAQLHVSSRLDQTEAGGMLNSAGMRKGDAQICSLALPCFYTHQGSPCSQVSGIQLPLEITPSLPSQLTPQPPPPNVHI